MRHLFPYRLRRRYILIEGVYSRYVFDYLKLRNFQCTCQSWAGAKVGNYQYSDFKRGDLYTYRPALAKLLDEALSRYPNVDIYFIINSELRPDIVESTLTICKHYSIPCIQLQNIEKRYGHPTAKGMKAIAEQVGKAIK